MAAGDFNNDHKVDLLVVGQNGSSSLGVLLGNGDGTLQPSLISSLTYLPSSVAVGDFSKDGNLDAAIADDLSGVTVLLGNGSFQPETVYDTTGLSGGPIVVAALRGDGELDLAVQAGPPAGVDVFWGNRDGSFQPAQLFASGQSGLPAVGDLNGDHLIDLVFANELWATTMLIRGH